MSDGYGELFIFDLNTPVFSNDEGCVTEYESPWPKASLKARQRYSPTIHNVCRVKCDVQQLITNDYECSLLDGTSAIDMPAALEAAFDDPIFLVTAQNGYFTF